MSKRALTFTCACGTESPQSRRGGIRTKCPECLEADHKAYSARYWIENKERLTQGRLAKKSSASQTEGLPTAEIQA